MSKKEPVKGNGASGPLRKIVIKDSSKRVIKPTRNAVKPVRGAVKPAPGPSKPTRDAVKPAPSNSVRGAVKPVRDAVKPAPSNIGKPTRDAVKPGPSNPARNAVKPAPAKRTKTLRKRKIKREPEPRYTFIKVSRTIHNWLVTVLLSAVLAGASLSPSPAHADPFGASAAAELAKLSEIIVKLTSLLEKTEAMIDLQRSLEQQQNKHFFQQLRTIDKQVQLANEILGGSPATDYGLNNNKLNEMVSVSEDLQSFADDLRDLRQQKGLHLLADSLRFFIDASIVTETSTQVLQQMARGVEGTSDDLVNSIESAEAQTLAGIHNTLAKVQHYNARHNFNTEVNRVNRQQVLLGSFAVFQN